MNFKIQFHYQLCAKLNENFSESRIHYTTNLLNFSLNSTVSNIRDY